MTVRSPLTPEEARVLGVPHGEVGHDARQLPAVGERARSTRATRSTNRDPIVALQRGDGRARARRAAREGADAAGSRRRASASSSTATSSRRRSSSIVPESTLLGVLLLRGAQTPGELKQRTERWHSFRSLDDVEETLRRLADRRASCSSSSAGPGQKEARWMQLLVAGRADAAPRRVGRARRAAAADAADRRRRPRREPEPEPRAARSRTRSRSAIPATGAVLRVGRGHRRARGRRRRSRGPARAQPAWAARPYDERAAMLARVPRPARSRGRGVRAAHDAARSASRSRSRATRSARCSSASTGTSSTRAT